jgi:hypothetical protein
VAGGGAQDPEGRHQVDVEHGLELLVGHLLDDVVPGVSGVVDNDVDPAECGERGIDELLRKFRMRHTTGKRGSAAAGCANGGLGLTGWSGIQIVDHHGSAAGGQLFRDRPSDSPP